MHFPKLFGQGKMSQSLVCFVCDMVEVRLFCLYYSFL